MPDVHSFFRDHRFYQDLQSETITLNWTRRDSLRGISGQTVGALDGLNPLCIRKRGRHGVLKGEKVGKNHWQGF